MKLTKDGITLDIENHTDIAAYKRLGFVEVVKEKKVVEPEKAPEPEPTQPEPTPEEQNAVAIEEANKPIGSKKGKGKS